MIVDLRGITLPKIPKLLGQNIEIERVNSSKCSRVILGEEIKLDRTF